MDWSELATKRDLLATKVDLELAISGLATKAELRSLGRRLLFLIWATSAANALITMVGFVLVGG